MESHVFRGEGSEFVERFSQIHDNHSRAVLIAELLEWRASCIAREIAAMTVDQFASIVQGNETIGGEELGFLVDIVVNNRQICELSDTRNNHLQLAEVLRVGGSMPSDPQIPLPPKNS